MSDKSIRQNHHRSPEWQPLISGQDQFYKAGAAKKNATGVLSEQESFKRMYERTGKNDAKDHFEPIYTYQDKKASAASPESNLPDKKDIKTDTAANELMQKEILEKLKKDAHEQGFLQGKKEGYDAGMLEAGKTVDSLAHIMSSLDDLWHRMVSRYENEIIELVKRISEKVIYGQTQIDNEIVKRAILKTFELIPDPTEATINVSAEDYEFIETAKEDLFEKIKSLKNVSIVSDPSLSRGGCRVETTSGEVDADIGSRLDAISRSIMDAANEIADDQ
ncbi:MAG: hypothetical protein C4522_18510 [Desulfobacteraceae bacterium]|nr:MAG: hypothetical protein C4522_18510 [Desulfobacteraceae bacterium]